MHYPKRQLNNKMGVMNLMPVDIRLNSLLCLSLNMPQHRQCDDTEPCNLVPARVRQVLSHLRLLSAFICPTVV